MVTIQAPIEITTAPKRYPPVGRCIYCGVYSSKLTKEHIIAHGLAGDSLLLPKSSCRNCADKTRDAETACLRHLWWPFRTRIGAPSSGKQPPKNFIVRQMKVTKIGKDGMVEGYDKTAQAVVGPMDYPLVFLTYKFEIPGLVIGRDPNSGTKTEIMARISEEEFRKFAPGDKDGFRIAPMDLDAYCRMLSKIAHAYATAELGYGSFRPVLCEFIRGGILERAWHWIGSDTATPPAEEHLHDIQWSTPTINGTNYVMISLRLFSFMGSPRYHIIVGELIRTLDQLPFLQQPLYAIDVKTALPVGEFVPLDERLGRTGA
jgi:hypothetical protein